MNAKFTAALVAGMMAVVAIAAGVAYSSQADEPGQVATDPVWLIGSADGRYLAPAGKEIVTNVVIDNTDPANPEFAYPTIDVNYGAFDNPIVEISVVKTNSLDTLDPEDYTQIFYDGPVDDDNDPDTPDVLSTVISVYTDPDGPYPIVDPDTPDAELTITVDDGQLDIDDGLFPVVIETAGEMIPTYYVFKVDITRTGGNFEDFPQTIYYAAYIEVTEKDLDDKVVVLTNERVETTPSTADASGADVKPGADVYNKGATGVTPKVFEIVQDTTVDAWALVQTTDADQIGLGTAEYLWENYDFYAMGLPLGLAMKLDGEISGKVSATVSVTDPDTAELPTFNVYAVDKNNGDGVYIGEIMYKIVAADDAFYYTIGDGETVSWSDPSYKVIRNTEGISITVENADESAFDADDYTVTVTLDTEEKKEIPDGVDHSSFTGGVITIPAGAFDDYTGILQIQIDKLVDSGRTYTAIVHVLVVGPVVHSGLIPTVTSN